jgi:hypothetical protein
MSTEEQKQYDEKDEKQQDEKQQDEKQEKDEKGWDEKWRQDPLSAAAWALILIWAGLVLLASNFGLIDWLPFLDGWSIFFIGAGAILLLEVGFRLLMPAYRKPVVGTLILGGVFLIIGLGGIFDWACILALVLVGLGVYLLLSGLLRRRE